MSSSNGFHKNGSSTQSDKRTDAIHGSDDKVSAIKKMKMANESREQSHNLDGKTFKGTINIAHRTRRQRSISKRLSIAIMVLNNQMSIIKSETIIGF